MPFYPSDETATARGAFAPQAGLVAFMAKRSRLQRAYPLAALLGGRLHGGLQHEVEIDLGEAPLHAPRLGLPGIVDETNFGDQFIPCGIGEVVMQVGIAGQVDLCSEVAMVRR